MSTDREIIADAIRSALKTRTFPPDPISGQGGMGLNEFDLADVVLTVATVLPCDGGCNYDDGPAEDCSAHGRTTAEVWKIVAEQAAEIARLTERENDLILRWKSAEDAYVRVYMSEQEAVAGQRDAAEARLRVVKALLPGIERKIAAFTDVRDRPGQEDASEYAMGVTVMQPILDNLRAALSSDWTPAACPSCGVTNPFEVRPPCSLDQYDPDEWHRSAVYRPAPAAPEKPYIDPFWEREHP